MPVDYCVNFGVRNLQCRDGKHCPFLHVYNNGRTIPTLGSRLAEEERQTGTGDPRGLHPSYKLDTTLALTAYLMKKRSKQRIYKVEQDKSTYTVILETRPVDPISRQVKIAGKCKVLTEHGCTKDINESHDTGIVKPELYVHAVRGDFPIERGMQILCSGLEHTSSDIHGVYSVSADATNVSKKLGSYDCGVAVVFTSEGFIANISTKVLQAAIVRTLWRGSLAFLLVSSCFAE